MKISALRLHNVKRFAGRGVAIEGIGDGVNVLCAANEYGKSTSFEALHGLFFQPHSSTAGDVRSLRPYSGGNPLIEADVIVGDARYRIAKQFYGGRFAKVTDLGSGRLIAQADEAENFIADLITGGAGGPAGLLWVRQGITGIERRSRAEEDSERQVRTSLLESVQGEVEAVTGGRRLAEILAAAGEASAALVTATGRPKTGGRYAAAIDARDRLAADERRLAGEVRMLQDDLDRRSKVQRRLKELEDGDERAARRSAVETAEAKSATARAQADRLKAAEAELNLVLERRDAAQRGHQQFIEAQEQARLVADESAEATSRRDDARERRNRANTAIREARAAIDAADDDARIARDVLDRLEAVERAREVAERRAGLEAQLERAEERRGVMEQSDALLTQLRLPDGAIDELAQLDIDIAGMRAVREAARPSIVVAYDGGGTTGMTMDGVALRDGEERGYDGQARIIVSGVGSLTLRSNAERPDDGRLEAAETQRRALLASMGVADLAAARVQQARAHQVEAEANEARAQLAVLVPDGLAALRETVAALTNVEPATDGLTGNPDEARAVWAAAGQRRRDAAEVQRVNEPIRSHAEEAFVAAETTIARLESRDQQAAAILGPADGREQRLQELAARLSDHDDLVAAARQAVEALRAGAFDVEAVDAALSRARSVEQAAETEIQQLREAMAGLNARIAAQADEAVEESWRETIEALAAAEARVAAFAQEVAVLGRLTQALETARANARDLYLAPVMTELRPLLGLLFDDVAITFDDRTLLPQTIERSGQVEDVERLSGGMREQLSVLTRLAFARLLASDGRPAPVILDDALVYSDDDRIERMFDALHRQARDQQIIVFSCRQRAFQKLGGNVLQMTSWQP